MAITWGSWNGHLRVGIEAWTDSYNTWTPSINVYANVHVQCDSSFSFSDNQHISLTGSAAGEWDFFNNLGPNQVVYIGRGIVANQVQSYSGGPTYQFNLQLSEAFNGAAPSATVFFTLPPRPPRAPLPPTSGPSYSDITPTSVFATWPGSSDYGGSGPTEDHVQLSKSSSFSSIAVEKYVSGTSSALLEGLTPGTAYWGRARVRNAVGWSGWSSVTSVQALSGAKIRSGGTWVEGIAKARVGGLWVPAKVNKRVGGTWVL